MSHKTGPRNPVVQKLGRVLVRCLRKSGTTIPEMFDVLYGARMVLVNRLFQPWTDQHCPFSRENFENLRLQEAALLKSLLKSQEDCGPRLDDEELANFKCNVVHDIAESGALISEVFEGMYEARMVVIKQLLKEQNGSLSTIDFAMIHWKEMTLVRWLLFPWEDKTCPTCPKSDETNAGTR